jgi:hypothetical protein
MRSRRYWVIGKCFIQSLGARVEDPDARDDSLYDRVTQVVHVIGGYAQVDAGGSQHGGPAGFHGPRVCAPLVAP